MKRKSQTRGGVTYFYSYEEARRAASRAGFPTDRIRSYVLGWAVQLHVSGPYLGPGVDPATHRCDWCPQKVSSPRPDRPIRGS